MFFLSQSINGSFLIRYFAPASVMNRKKINDAARNDEQKKNSRNEFAGQSGSPQRETPQPPERKRNEQIGDNYPDVNEFLISQEPRW